jgi:UTP--glucose-1-phosphate uridylyltransferase
MAKVRKAVIPAAGYGTRMLPITKTVSKEILPLVDKPIIQQVVEELVEAGITEIIIITSSHKTDLVSYFSDIDPGLAQHLRNSGPEKAAILDNLEHIKQLANFAFIEQQPGYGTGFPVLTAEAYIGNEPFIYTFADDFFVSEQNNSFLQLISAYEKYNAPVWGGQQRTSDADYDRYGFVGGQELEPGVISVGKIVERPGRENAPGDLASLGGFIVTPEVLPYLHRVKEHLEPGKELYFNSALSLMVEEGKQVIGKYIDNAQYFDTGNKLEYMKTTVTMAANHPEIGDEFKQFLADFVRGNQ